MQNKSIISTISLSIILSGCTFLDKTLAPVDSAINTTKIVYTDTSHYLDSSLSTFSHQAKNTKSDLYETSFVKYFMTDKYILQNREESFIKWSGSSRYNSTTIIKEYFKNQKITLDLKTLLLSDKMKILQDYFYEKFETKYILEFTKNNPKVKYDMFLTDRQNIENIYKYKLALKEHEHQWDINLEEVQKKVAALLVSTLFGIPKVTFLAYDPYDEMMYLSLTSNKKNFNEKIKVEIDQNDARKFQKSIVSLDPTIYFNLNENKLEIIGAKLQGKYKQYRAEFTDTSYFRKNTIVFSNDTIDLKNQDVEYTKIVQNITPPSWFYHLEENKVGYGQGKNEKDAKVDAFNAIAQSIKVVVNSNFTAKKNIEGSFSTKTLKSDTNIKADGIIIENSQVIQSEKKDGIWFVAIKY